MSQAKSFDLHTLLGWRRQAALVTLGNLRPCQMILGALAELPQPLQATDTEVFHFIARRSLFGRDVGYVDAHLLAATRLTAGAALRTRDKRLGHVATELALAM
jgi:hypothetical protein